MKAADTSLPSFGSRREHGWSILRTEGLRTLRAHALFLAIVLAYALSLLITARMAHPPTSVRVALYSVPLIYILTVLALMSFVLYGLRLLVCVRPAHPLRYMTQDLGSRYLTARRLLNAAPVILALPVFMSTFTSYKMMIPVLHPFSWDETFAHWDALVHGGRQPWEWLQPLLGRPLLTAAINSCYNSWFSVVFVMLFWQAFSLRDPRLRMQFFLTYVLSWILLGTLAAVAFSSAGPCFYGRFAPGEDVYRPLMDYLHTANSSVHIWALDAQEMLWKAYQRGEVDVIRGISAMPSMHISMTFLFAVTGWRRHRVLGIALAIYGVLVLIGCVHLGWHYAIDGYAAVGATGLIWWTVGRLQAVFARRPSESLVAKPSTTHTTLAARSTVEGRAGVDSLGIRGCHGPQ